MAADTAHFLEASQVSTVDPKQKDAGPGELSDGPVSRDCQGQDLSVVNTESKAVDKTLQIAWACSMLLHW